MSASPSPHNPSLTDLHQLSTSSRRYHADSTILLVGFIGAGKKTLGFIASAALRRRFIDFEAIFQTKYETTPQEFTAAHGFARYREVEIELCEELLSKYQHGCVIAGLGITGSFPRLGILSDFTKCHPVIYVRRDKEDLQQTIGADTDKFERIFKLGNTFFESISNFDFFNITQRPDHQSASKAHASLKLKNIERVFVAFLYRIFGKSQQRLFSTDPFSATHTYALHLSLNDLEGLDLEVLDAGADAINLLLSPEDYSQEGCMDRLSYYMTMLRKHTRVSIIIDPIADSPRPSASYWKFLKDSLRLAPDGFTASTERAEIFRQISSTKGHSKMIALHNQLGPLGRDSSAELISSFSSSLEDLRFDILRLTGQQAAAEDTLSCVSFGQWAREVLGIPVIAYNNSPGGRASRILNPTMSPVSISPNMNSAISMQEARQALSSLSVFSEKTFTIVGQDVQLSLSPAMHNAAYRFCGLPHTYKQQQIEDFGGIQAIFKSPAFGGLLDGITISLPFKADVLPLLQKVSPDAQDINAVNTVVLDYHVDSNGTKTPFYHGYNTDYIGIMDCIYSHLSPANAVRQGSTALIIGAGGMARAAVYSCYQLGVRRIFLYNRSPSNAHSLARYYNQWARSKGDEDFQVDVIPSKNDPWPAGVRLPTIVVSCIPGRHVGTCSPVELQISDKWLESRTGGVYVEVSFLLYR